MFEDGLLEAVLLVDGAFGKGEVAVRDKANRADDLGALEHADDAPDGAAGALALDAQNLLGDLGRDDSATTSIRTILREQRRKAAVAIGVIPGLDGAG